MPRRDEATLLDILVAARRIRQFCDGMDASAFLGDSKTQSAVLHQLLIIGEATKRLSQQTRDEHRHIPWRFMAGMRDQLIHAYDDVDLQEVLQTATRDIPQLMTWLEAIISPSESP